MAICSHSRPLGAGIQGWRYKEPAKPPVPMNLGQHLWYESLQRAEAVAHICFLLEEKGWRPDRILAHSGWGETLGIKEVWPQVPQILWPELWMRPEHGGYGIDPLLPPSGLKQSVEQLGRNALTRIALDQASAWVMPTQHQARSLPPTFQGSSLNVIHEGIDTSLACPNPSVSFVVRGITINRSIPTITFVNRNLERLRGFDQFMRALPALQRQWPDLRILIVGDSEKGYGNPHPSGNPLRQVMLDELAGQLDLERIHFLGRVPYSQLLAILQASWVHVYLSYPFVLGWSLLEAMSCGCGIVGSCGMPVEEVIYNGVEGLLVPMDNSDALAARVSALLSNPALRQQLGNAARKRALAFDQSRTLPKLSALIEGGLS